MEITEELLKRAVAAAANAYAPYSGYQVGAAVCTTDGKIYAAANVENISFPCGTCAEAGAIAAMVADGGRKITAVLVSSSGKELVYPCGACLQRIAEFSSPKIPIYLADLNKIVKICTLSELLPCAFKAGELKQ